MNRKSFAPLPMVHAKKNRVDWIPVLRRKKSVNISKAPTTGIERIYYSKKKFNKFEIKIRPGRKLFIKKFINYLQPRINDRKIMKITTIVEHIQSRLKRDIKSQLDIATPRNEANFSKSQIPSEKVKRIEENFENSTINQRHRRSTVDDSSKDQKLGASQKRGEKKDPPKPLYTPIFKDCNDTTAASEIDDLNILPPKSKFSRPPISLVTKKINDPPKIGNNNKKLRALENADGTKKLLKSSPFTAKESGYVNLRDHQEESRSKNQSKEAGKDLSTLGYPKDIKPYNPDIIPYVDVPDYTDQREESLDEDDRRVAKERYSMVEKNGDERTANVNGDDDDVDVVDPDEPEASERLSDSLRNPETSRNKNESESEKALDEVSEKMEDEDDDRSKNEGISSENEDENVENRSKALEKFETLQIVDHEDGKSDEIEDGVEYRRQDNNKPISDFEPVYFDDAYDAKPLNYHKLFTDEESRDDESAKEFVGEDLPESSHEMFSEQYEKLAKPEHFDFEDKEFFQPISEHAHEKPDNFDGESDFLTKYFTPDVIGKFKKPSNENLRGQESQESSEENKEESYETLPTNLQKNNPKPLNKDRKVNRKDGPKDYKKFWTLEYSFPPKKTDE